MADENLSDMIQAQMFTDFYSRSPTFFLFLAHPRVIVTGCEIKRTWSKLADLPGFEHC